MASIEMENVAHRYPDMETVGSAYALKPLNIKWEDGGAYALLGPSGCGKTTLLNILSGLLSPTTGRVLFNGQDVTALAPQDRNIAQVFQFPVIYDTMTVAENLAFPLRNHGVPRNEIDIRVAEVLELLDLTSVAKRKARHLAADEKQKVSLGRGLVRTNTNAILFDEPLTVVDPAIKWALRAQLKQVHQRLGHTMIYVTHDQTEALTFADKVAVMLDGEILQVATPQALFEQPEHTFVGRFIGSPGMNILPCQVTRSHAVVGNQKIVLGNTYAALSGCVELGIRPEHVRLVERGTHRAAVPVEIVRVDDIGRQKIAHLTLEHTQVNAVVPERSTIPLNPAVILDTDYIHLYQHAHRIKPTIQGHSL